MTIQTDRVILKPWKQEDLPIIQALCSNSEVMAHIEGGAMAPEFANMILDFFLNHYKQHAFGPMAALLKSTGQIIGIAGMKKVDGVSEADFSFMFFKEYWNKGYATEIGKALISYAFEHLKVQRVTAIVSPMNAAMIKGLQKLGMHFEKKINHRGSENDFYVIEAPSVF